MIIRLAMKPCSKPLLIGESFSPWTKKARWALEFCGLEYDYQEYVPTLSEPGLRWRLQQFRDKVSVPVMLWQNQVYPDSWSIASFANKQARGKLGNFNEIEHWDQLSEIALAQGRTNVIRRVMANDQALAEALPPFIPNTLRYPLRFIARFAARRLDRKYQHLLRGSGLRTGLTALREGLQTSTGDFLLEDFSYADICMAVIVEVISPIAKVEPPPGPATSECWIDSKLATEFEDLLLWRNRLAQDSDISYSQFLQS